MVEVKLHDQLSDDVAHPIIDQAFYCIEKIQKLMSFHDPESELSKLNRIAFQQTVQVHPLSYAVLKRAQRVFYTSSGLFDCTIANTLVDWELLPQHFPSTNTDFQKTSQACLQLLEQNQVKFTAPILLDLGGIAKGFAVDLAIYNLKKNGIKNAVVNAGGDLRVIGDIFEEILIRDPFIPQQFHNLGNLKNGAIATSSCYFSKVKKHNKWVNALVHPDTRQALDSKQSFSVIAPNACIADALSKVVAISQNPLHPCLNLFSAQALII